MKQQMIQAKEPQFTQQVYYCLYCSRTNLMYLQKENRLIGLGLDRWLFCPKCKRKFKMGIYGIHEQELNVHIEILKKTVLRGK